MYLWMKEDNTILRKNVKELQQQLQKAYKRIGELTHKRDLPL